MNPLELRYPVCNLAELAWVTRTNRALHNRILARTVYSIVDFVQHLQRWSLRLMSRSILTNGQLCTKNFIEAELPHFAMRLNALDTRPLAPKEKSKLTNLASV